MTQIIGVDEAGRGALAGPVVAAAVLDSEKKLNTHPQIKDSKAMSQKQREEVFAWIKLRV